MCDCNLFHNFTIAKNPYRKIILHRTNTATRVLEIKGDFPDDYQLLKPYTMDNNQDRPATRRNNLPSTNSILGITFGIFMVFVYVGMGILLFINFFNWGADWAWTRWVVGAVLIIYGIFRGYRTYTSFVRQRDDR